MTLLLSAGEERYETAAAIAADPNGAVLVQRRNQPQA
jgi:hypothetical protein